MFMEQQISWDAKAQEIYDRVTKALPEFHRTIAKRLVKESAEALAKNRGLDSVQEKELVETFFLEVPPAFKTMMVRLFEHLKIEYKTYINA
jgi:hypothetical protein